jgi:hypothetical protein
MRLPFFSLDFLCNTVGFSISWYWFPNFKLSTISNFGNSGVPPSNFTVEPTLIWFDTFIFRAFVPYFPAWLSVFVDVTCAPNACLTYPNVPPDVEILEKSLSFICSPPVYIALTSLSELVFCDSMKCSRLLSLVPSFWIPTRHDQSIPWFLAVSNTFTCIPLTCPDYFSSPDIQIFAVQFSWIYVSYSCCARVKASYAARFNITINSSITLW